MSTRDTVVYQYGTTVRFEADFFDFDGLAVDPELITLKIYNAKYTVIHEQPGVKVQASVGKYYYDYETEPKEQRLFYEWYAEIGGKPSLKRGEFMTKFI